MLEEEPMRKRWRYWVHPIVSQQAWKGHFSTLYQDLRQHPDKFIAFCRMSVPMFDRLLELLRAGLTYEDTNMRRSVSAEERLIITLRFLATGNSYASLHYEFLLGTSTIGGIIRPTCHLIWMTLKEMVMPQPTPEDWLRIADGFQDSAQFPNCIGALDGKHIRVKKPAKSGSRFYNYKQYFSVVLLALADSNHSFVSVDIGAYRSTADAGIFKGSRMGERLRNNQLSRPEARSHSSLWQTKGLDSPSGEITTEWAPQQILECAPHPATSLQPPNHVQPPLLWLVKIELLDKAWQMLCLFPPVSLYIMSLYNSAEGAQTVKSLCLPPEGAPYGSGPQSSRFPCFPYSYAPGLSPHLMRNFPRSLLDIPKRAFNYRLTRALRYVECAFGILAAKWRLFHSAIQMDPNNADWVIKACVLLHNFTPIHDATLDVDLDNCFPSPGVQLDNTLHGRPGSSGIEVRDLYADYFMTPEGSVPWQQDLI